MAPIQSEYLVLGAGITGLTAGAALGHRAIVVERDPRPGGLVRTECRNGYWFDRVLHILHVADPRTEAGLLRIPGVHLAPCPPIAWVECSAGVTHSPIQMHLGRLAPEAVVRCLRDLADAAFRVSDRPAANFEEWLLRTFGCGLCELFMFPYNRKLWKRPLTDLAPDGFNWNIAPPDFERVLMGALLPETPYRSYNARAFYPRPPRDAPVRGMETFSRALAAMVGPLRLQEEVVELDLDRRLVTTRRRGQLRSYRYLDACLATLPLPYTIRLCRQAPAALRSAAAELTRNRVVMVNFSLVGARPAAPGHWRYYGDESLMFTRLIYMHEFDPHTAPPEGWGLMAEIVEPAEAGALDEYALRARVRTDLARVGALPEDCRIIDEHVVVADPAYVVFTPRSREIVAECVAFLAQRGVTALGRFGRWEYSSMCHAFQDALDWAEQRGGTLEPLLMPQQASPEQGQAREVA